MNTEDQNWSNGNNRSSVRNRNEPRRSSRSRSPGASREGLVYISGFEFYPGCCLSKRSIFNNPNSVNPGNNLHVSGLSHRIDTRDLEAAFSKIGRVRELFNPYSSFDIFLFLCQVKKASVMYDPHTRESRGFGFVTMESAEEADAAIAALNATDLMGKVMNVEKVIRVLPIIFIPLANVLVTRPVVVEQGHPPQAGIMDRPSVMIVSFFIIHI